MSSSSKRSLLSHTVSTLWDLCCLGSLVGIWPRFIEPRMLFKTRLSLPINNLPHELEGLRIAHLSDIHIDPSMPHRFLQKIIDTVNEFEPDLILFTGDFLRYARLSDPDRLHRLLGAMPAAWGCYASLGNHDYNRYLGINRRGDYDIATEKLHGAIAGVARLAFVPTLTGTVTEQAKTTHPHPALNDLLDDSPFQLLHNRTVTIPIKNTFLNITGLGELMAGQFLPTKAFQRYDDRYPGLVLSHNPDTIPPLTEWPGDLILCGHTHGGAVNLPGIWQRLTLLENPQFVRGLVNHHHKTAYISRGLGGTFTFRWFSPPEVALITLRAHTASISTVPSLVDVRSSQKDRKD